MNTSSDETTGEAAVCDVRFAGDKLVLVLDDEREVSMPFKKIKWLAWLAAATPKQRADWTIEPHGYAVWWNALDDGIEVVHALSAKRLPHHVSRKSVSACSA